MPSIRKRLKKLTSSKKSKSTGDLDKMEQAERRSIDDDDVCSHISEALSERTDVSLNESSYSYASNSEEKKKKKKRRLNISLSKKKKKEGLVKDPTGTVIFRTLSVEHDPRGVGRSKENIFAEADLLKPESVELSKSVGSNISRDDSSEADGWRISGLMENVDRTPNDNLITTYEERRKVLQRRPDSESTPVKNSGSRKVAEASNEQDAITTFTKASHVVEVSFSSDGSKALKEGIEDENEYSDQPEQKKSGNDCYDDYDDDDLAMHRAALEPVQEDDVIELRSVDPECEIEFFMNDREDEKVKNKEAIAETEITIEECEKARTDKMVEVINDHSVICDTGQGKKVIIRHLEEVVNRANMELSKEVKMDDWLVLNIEKDDWVVVGYSKVGGEVTSLFEQSVDTV